MTSVNNPGRLEELGPEKIKGSKMHSVKLNNNNNKKTLVFTAIWEGMLSSGKNLTECSESRKHDGSFSKQLSLVQLELEVYGEENADELKGWWKAL